MPILQEILVEQLKDLLHAEGQLVKALPKMARAANDPKLKEAFRKHLEETKNHVERLKQVFELLGEKAKGKPCRGMQGLVEEGQETIEEGREKPNFAADLALVVAAQKVEHYEIATYGSLVQITKTMGMTEIADILAKTLVEEKDTDQLLTDIAENNINMQAEEEEGGQESED